MKDSNVQCKYSWFINTFQHCGNFLYNEEDDMIEYHLFEEFCIDVRSFFYSDFLKELSEELLISDEVVDNCTKIRSMVFNIEGNCREIYNVKSVRKDERWKQIFDLIDSTYKMLTNKNLKI